MTSKPVIVYLFTSPTCGPCKTIKPFWNELREDDDSVYSKFTWMTIDITADRENYVQLFGVTAVPTMVVTVDGNVFGSSKGTSAMGYLNLLKRASVAAAGSS